MDLFDFYQSLSWCSFYVPGSYSGFHIAFSFYLGEAYFEPISYLLQNSEEQCFREINFKAACEIDFRAES